MLRQPALDPVVQRARAREMRDQIFHLIGEYAATLEEDVFRVSGRERHCDQLHARLLRGARGLLVVAAAAGRYDVRPQISAPLAEGTDVIARQLARGETARAVHAQIRVAPEQGLVV